MRHGKRLRTRWSAALLLGALALGGRAWAKGAEATVAADAGKTDVEGAKDASLFSGSSPFVLKVKGPGTLRLGLRAKLPSKEVVHYAVEIDFKKAESGTLEGGKEGKGGAGAEKEVTVEVPAGAHDVSVTSRGGEGIGRIIPELSADLAIPELAEDLPIEEVAAKRPDEAPAAPAPAAPSAAPAAPAPAPVVDVTPVASPTWQVHLRPFAAVGTVSENGFSSPLLPGLGAASSQFQVGAFALAAHGPLSIVGEVRDGFYHRSYVTRWNGPDGKLPTLELDEQNLALGVTFGWELMHHISPTVADKLQISPFLGPAARLLLNDAAPQNIVGVQAGARFDWAASDGLVIGASGGFLPNFSFIQALGYKGVPLLLGAPKSATDVRVDALVKLSGPAHLRVAWDSEYLVLQLAYRSYQAVSVSFDYGF